MIRKSAEFLTYIWLIYAKSAGIRIMTGVRFVVKRKVPTPPGHRRCHGQDEPPWQLRPGPCESTVRSLSASVREKKAEVRYSRDPFLGLRTHTHQEAKRQIKFAKKQSQQVRNPRLIQRSTDTTNSRETRVACQRHQKDTKACVIPPQFDGRHRQHEHPHPASSDLVDGRRTCNRASQLLQEHRNSTFSLKTNFQPDKRTYSTLTASDRNAMLAANHLVFSGKIDYNTKALLDGVDIRESFWDQYGILQEYNDLSVMPSLSVFNL